MPTSTLRVVTRAPIPGRMEPDAVLAALHTYEPLIRANPLATRYERRPVPLEDLTGDAFFREDGLRLSAFVVHDRVPLLPGGVGASWASLPVAIPCVFQSFDRGVRCRADAQGGVTVRSSYEVRRRGELPPFAGEENEADDGGEPQAHIMPGDWELVEIASIECGPMVKLFVKRSFASAHREILRRVVDECVRMQGTGGYSSGGQYR